MLKRAGLVGLLCIAALPTLVHAQNYVPGEVIVRLKGDKPGVSAQAFHSKAQAHKAMNLKQAWDGDEAQDVALQSRDQITVRSEYRTPWKVTLAGEVKRSGSFTINPGERLSSVLKRAGGFTDKAFLKGVIFTRRSVRRRRSGYSMILSGITSDSSWPRRVN